MAQINLSAWAIRHSTLMHFFMILVALAGVHAYFALGQSEDPPFAVRTMVVRAYLPGATIDETMRELTDRIEKKLEEAPYLDYLKSYTTPGETTIFVNLQSGTPASELPECWYQVRKKVGDISYTLPSETSAPTSMTSSETHTASFTPSRPTGSRTGNSGTTWKKSAKSS